MTTRQEVSGDGEAVELTLKIEGISSTRTALIANLTKFSAQTVREHYNLSSPRTSLSANSAWSADAPTAPTLPL